MSPSAVSKAVMRLEESLSIRLMNRTTRKITLTDDGAAFYERCQQILGELEEAELELKRSQLTPTGTLRIDLTTELGQIHIIPALPQFIERYPDLKLNISVSNRIADVIEEGIDAVVRIGAGPDSSLIMHGVGMARFIVCAAPNYLRRYGIPQTLEDLKHHNCISFVSPWTGRVFDWQFQQDGQKIRLPVEGNLYLNNGESILDVALAGVGLVQVYNYIAGEAIAQDKLKPVLEKYAAPGSPISVVYPQKRHLSAKVRVFVDFMNELMEQLRQQKIVE
ncbi:LysR family transcriptional regulator [Chroococcidiopsis cubana SAG 39.79]|uniref:LysR family transcriptional regulator n=2 Tax=Chroococcidiopsis TaxID=54298 RepID=A0AB37UBN9_9CYAN|nr:LysR family transcriptional regulator [Chroococcidiopsis cubana SAG 39.79]